MESKTPEEIAADLVHEHFKGMLMSEQLFKEAWAEWDLWDVQNMFVHAIQVGYNHRQPEVDELKRQVEELMAFNETCLQNNKSLTAAKEKELEDWKTIANVYKQRNNELTDPPQIQNLNKWAVVHITDEYDSPEEAQEHIETIHKKIRQYYKKYKITTI